MTFGLRRFAGLRPFMGDFVYHSGGKFAVVPDDFGSMESK
jgi:hypothetical protein